MAPDDHTGPGVPEARSYVPVPDPTVLTTEALKREIASSRELIEIRVTGIRDTQEAKISGVMANIALIEERVNKLVDRATHEVGRLQELHAEKFAAVQNQFEERDKRTEQLTMADKTAIAAALQAQKEAVNAQNIANATATTKAEIAFTKQIDSLADKINDIKSRVDQGAGKEKGATDLSSLIMGIAAIVISFGTLFFLVFTHNPNAPVAYSTTQTK
jgi:hypothetical protein